MMNSFRRTFSEFFNAFIATRDVDVDPRMWLPATVAEWRAAFVEWAEQSLRVDETSAREESYFSMSEKEAATYLDEGFTPLGHDSEGDVMH